jgi:hypothetical protein
MTLSNKIRVVLWICGIVAALVAGLFLAARYLGHKELEDIKPYVTYSILMNVARDCDEYKRQNSTWPSSLAQLIAFRPELTDWAKDGWGRYVELVPYNESIGYGQIISYGRDGKPGGTGPDRDLVVRFPTDTNADWNKEQGAGLKEPRFRF